MPITVFDKRNSTVKKSEMPLIHHIWESYVEDGKEYYLYPGATFHKKRSGYDTSLEIDAILFTPHSIILIEMKGFNGQYQIIENGSNPTEVLIMQNGAYANCLKNPDGSDKCDDKGNPINYFYHGIKQLKDSIIDFQWNILPGLASKGINVNDECIKGIFLIGNRDTTPDTATFDDRRSFSWNPKRPQVSGTLDKIYPVSNCETTITDFNGNEEKCTFWSLVNTIDGANRIVNLRNTNYYIRKFLFDAEMRANPNMDYLIIKKENGLYYDDNYGRELSLEEIYKFEQPNDAAREKSRILSYTHNEKLRLKLLLRSRDIALVVMAVVMLNVCLGYPFEMKTVLLFGAVALVALLGALYVYLTSMRNKVMHVNNNEDYFLRLPKGDSDGMLWLLGGTHATVAALLGYIYYSVWHHWAMEVLAMVFVAGAVIVTTVYYFFHMPHKKIKTCSDSIIVSSHICGVTLFKAVSLVAIAWIVKLCTVYFSQDQTVRVEQVLGYDSYMGLPSVANATDRQSVVSSIKQTGRCKLLALTSTNGVAMVYGTNGYYTSNVSESLSNTLRDLNGNHEMITDITLTEDGRWLVLYGVNSWRGFMIPEALNRHLERCKHYDDTVFAASFNDKDEWIAVGSDNFQASNGDVKKWIKEGIKTSGKIINAYVGNNCVIAVHEMGVRHAGHIPQTMEDFIAKREWNIYSARCVGDSWFVTDKDGLHYNGNIDF